LTSQFQNYIPFQDLATGAPPGIDPVETVSEAVVVDNQGDANPTETMAESVVVTVTWV